jgi:hypothetical protein
MIHNVVLVDVKDGVPREELEAALAELRAFTVPGISMNLTVHEDIGLRNGNARFAIFGEFGHVEDYLAYDSAPSHAQLRADVLAPIAEDVLRMQYEAS